MTKYFDKRHFKHLKISFWHRLRLWLRPTQRFTGYDMAMNGSEFTIYWKKDKDKIVIQRIENFTK